MTNSTISGNYVSYDGGGGGGISNYGTLNVANSTISGNFTNVAAGTGPAAGVSLAAAPAPSPTAPSLAIWPSGGGGISNSGTLTITNSTISGNRSQYGTRWSASTATAAP